MSVVRILLLTTVLLAIAGGCGGDGDDESSALQLEDTPWVLVPRAGNELPEGAAPSATFAEGRMAGSTGCNRYTAPFTLDGDRLQLGSAAATQMACPPPFDEVERSFLDALDRVERWSVDDEMLTLSDGDGNEVLRFEAASLTGSWRATGILEGDAFKSIIVGTEITATFGEGGTLSGSAGCNRYHSRYTVDRGELTIELPAGTQKFCAEPEGVMEQEQSYLALLPSAARFHLDGRGLELTAADGQRLVDFERDR